MKIEGDHIFKGPKQAVWDMFMDANALAGALPGTQELNKVSDTEYDGSINVRVGPVSGSFAGKLVMSNVNAPDSCTLTVDGRGSPGFVNGMGNVNFSDPGDGTTLLKYDGEVQIGGTLASVGQRMLDSVSKSMIRQAFEALDQTLAARLAAQETGQEVEKIKAPSETDYAKGVAADMGKEAMSIAEVRMLMYVIPAGIILAIIAFLLSRYGG